MGTHAIKPAPKKPAPAVDANAKAPAPKPKPVVPAPAMPTGPATYAADRLVARLLQQALVHGEQAFAVYTEARRANLLVHAETMVALVQELSVVARDPEVNWGPLAKQLASLALIVDHLVYELGPTAVALSAQLSAAYAQLVFLVPPTSLGATPGRSGPAPLDATAQLELSRQAIGAARAHLAALPVFEPKSIATAVAAFCEPLQLHLAIATDAAHAVTDRGARRTLKPDVEALSTAMDELAERLSMKPEIPWNASFASAFDSEISLRAELGLAKRVRPYSGTVNPATAVQQAHGIANGVATDARAERYTDPVIAVQAVHDAVITIFARQRGAIADLEQFLDVKDQPSSRSGVDILLEIGASVALMGAAGAIGGAVATFLKPRLEALQIGLNVPKSALSLLSKDEQALVTSEVLSRGALSRAVVGDALKDASKEMFKSAFRQVTARTSPPFGLSALKAFVYAQQQRLVEATQLAGIAVRHLGPALQQADLGTLNALAHTLETDMPQVAHDKQYDHSMREWQNFKARASLGPPTLPMGRANERDAAVGAEHTPGVLEIGLAYSSDRVVSRRSLRLVGAEPAARSHFRNLRVALGTVGLNQRYEVLLTAPGHFETLVFGVAPDRGLLVESFSSREWRLLQMLAERRPATRENVNRALRGEFSATENSAALRVARGFVQAASSYNTSSLED